MESEKVKEILGRLHCKLLGDRRNEINCEEINCVGEVITYINELESENERLNKSDTSKEESSVEYYNLYKDLKRKNKDLNELCELQRVSIAESFVRENQLKDRIAELEKENAKLNIELDKRDCIDYPCRLIEKEHLKQFAEKVLKFVKEYAFKDRKEIYTNGTILVPLFRVEYALETGGQYYQQG